MYLKLLMLVSTLAVWSLPAVAQESANIEGLDEPKVTEPRETNKAKLARLFSELESDPENLDLTFEYGTLAMNMGKFKEAIAAYDRMLTMKPDLARIKLDKALAHMQIAEYDKAENLFSEVLESNPPANVKDNISRMQERLVKASIRHHFSSAIVTGFNSDSNANATPASGAVDTLFGPITLDDSSARVSDDHVFTALTGKYKYIVPGQNRHEFNTEATVYKTKQSSLENLELSLLTVKTGFTFNIPEWKSKLGCEVGATDVTLDDNEYLRSYAYSVFAEKQFSPKFKMDGRITYEDRSYTNTPTNTTYELRDGHSLEEKLTGSFIITPKDMLKLSIGIKQEETKVSYNDNSQMEIQGQWTHVFPNDWFGMLTLSGKNTKYKSVDSFVNPNIIRNDNERYYTVGLGKKITDKLTGLVSYQYKEVNSNIQNYEFENERISVMLSCQF